MLGFELIVTAWVWNLGNKIELYRSISSMKMSVNTDQKSKLKFWIVEKGMEGGKTQDITMLHEPKVYLLSWRPGSPISKRMW